MCWTPSHRTGSSLKVKLYTSICYCGSCCRMYSWPHFWLSFCHCVHHKGNPSSASFARPALRFTVKSITHNCSRLHEQPNHSHIPLCLFTGSSPTTLATSTQIASVPNTNKHSTEGSNPIWQTIIEKEWSNNNTLNKLEKEKDENFVSINDIFTGTMENQSTLKQFKKHLNGYNTQKNLNSSFGSIFHNMDKFGHDCEILPKKPPTTEL